MFMRAVLAAFAPFFQAPLLGPPVPRFARPRNEKRKTPFRYTLPRRPGTVASGSEIPGVSDFTPSPVLNHTDFWTRGSPTPLASLAPPYSTYNSLLRRPLPPPFPKNLPCLFRKSIRQLDFGTSRIRFLVNNFRLSPQKISRLLPSSPVSFDRVPSRAINALDSLVGYFFGGPVPRISHLGYTVRPIDFGLNYASLPRSSVKKKFLKYFWFPL